jgi:hypothetical protein
MKPLIHNININLTGLYQNLNMNFVFSLPNIMKDEAVIQKNLWIY